MLFKTATLLLASMASMASANSSENALTPANQGERKLDTVTLPLGQRVCVAGCDSAPAADPFGPQANNANGLATGIATRIDAEADGRDGLLCVTLFALVAGDTNTFAGFPGTIDLTFADDVPFSGSIAMGSAVITGTDVEELNGMTLSLRCEKMPAETYFTAGPYDFLGSDPNEQTSSVGTPVGTSILHDDHIASVTVNEGQVFTDGATDFRRSTVVDTGLAEAATVTLCVNKEKPGINGEPHIHTWSGEWFDFQGGCDLVMLSNADFLNGLGLDIHIRTIVRYDYSFIRSVAVRLGEDTIEVSSYGAYSVNGVSDVPLPLSLASGHTIFHKQISPKKHEFTLPTGNGDEAIVITTMKDIVNVNIENLTSEFDGSKGLMGTLDIHGQAVGKLLGRDGKTVFEDHDAFGFEWQVNDEDPQLFRAPGDVVYPQKCAMPTMAANGRRLGESKVSKEEAEKACANKSGKEKENCIYDVLALGDTDMVV